MKKIVFIIFLSLLFAACQKKEEPKPQYQYPAAPGPGQMSDKAQLLRDAVQKDPKNVDAWITLGDIQMDSSQFSGAIEAYQKALAINPQNVDVRVDLGTCYRNTGKPDIALKEYTKALEIRPDHPIAHRNLGVVLAYDLKDNVRGTKELEKYLQLAPGAPDAAQIRERIEKLKAAK